MAETCVFARDAAQRLRKTASELDSCPAPQVLGPWTVPFGSLEIDGARMLSELYEMISEDRSIYMFELTDASATSILRSTLQNLKSTKMHGFSAPKVNLVEGNSRCLYVGSSFATGKRRHTLVARLKQHLGLSNTSTYAMHLQRWARDIPGAITINVWQYSKNVDRLMVLAIEDALAEMHQPLLGKRGTAR